MLDFVFDHEEESENRYFHKVKLVELESNKVFSDKLTFIYQELPKFRETEEQLDSHF